MNTLYAKYTGKDVAVIEEAMECDNFMSASEAYPVLACAGLCWPVGILPQPLAAGALNESAPPPPLESKAAARVFKQPGFGLGGFAAVSVESGKDCSGQPCP